MNRPAWKGLRTPIKTDREMTKNADGMNTVVKFTAI